MTITPKRMFVWLVAASVVTAVAFGLFLAGSPEQERMRRFDQERVSDLQQISSGIDVYWNQSGKLPDALELLRAQQNVYLRSLNDPRTQQPYEYVPAGTSTYRLCADFETDSVAEAAKQFGQQTYPAENDFWKHPIGRTCYNLETHVNPAYVKPALIVPSDISP